MYINILKVMVEIEYPILYDSLSDLSGNSGIAC